MTALGRYLAKIKNGKIVLWCYLIWYLTTVYFYFDPAPKIWINALGISAIIGLGLMLSVDASGSRWQTARLFMMPFAVSSFSALIKGQGFLFVFSPVLNELLVGVALCAMFVVLVLYLRHRYS
ncbi:MAG: asparagine N-glycosylation enzyme membrane subunit Stt3 [Zhongshania aliphaticivorans]|jgi:asparagine N-glycosylation enzyme membrane subunit Stt3